MANSISAQDLQNAQALYDELLADVKVEEGLHSGTTRLGPASQLIEDLKLSKVSFGNPKDLLIQLTPSLLEQLNITLDPIQQYQLQNQYDFYHMSLTVSLFPRRSNLFRLIECRLMLRCQDGNAPIVQSIFPQPRWRTVLEWGGGLNLALNGQLDWDVGVPPEQIETVRKLAGAPAASLKTNNEIKSRILVPDYAFRMGRAEIVATGMGSDECNWRLVQPELQETQTARFIIIFKVPKGTKAVELEGIVVAEPDMQLLVAEVQDIFSELKDKFKKLFRKSDKDRMGDERMPIGDHLVEVLHLQSAPVQVATAVIPPANTDEEETAVSPPPTSQPNTLAKLSATDRKQLRDNLNDYFSLSELRELIQFDLNLDPDNFPGAKSEVVSKLLADLENRNRIDELRQIGQRERNFLTW